MIKFHNLWTIEAPEGYSVLFTHPANRFDLPFTTLTGLVDCDRYHDNWIHFPAHWHDTNFSGVLPKGTPVAQCMPVKRESWVARTATFTKEEAQRAHDLSNCDLPRDRHLSAAVPGITAVNFFQRQEFRGGARPQKETAVRSGGERGDRLPGQLRRAMRYRTQARFSRLALTHLKLAYAEIVSRHGIVGPHPERTPKRSAAAAYSPSSAITLASPTRTSYRSGAAASSCEKIARASARSLRLIWKTQAAFADRPYRG